ncbi:hypothetical protein I3760_13G149500 [Carya illinoinensis]|nr:hypothetical protein I3760_13G149500 [Carya illinoinensis]
MDIFGFFGWICSLLVLSRIVAKIRCLWPRVAAHDHGGSWIYCLLHLPRITVHIRCKWPPVAAHDHAGSTYEEIRR